MPRHTPMNRIKELREAAGLTADELADALGTSRQQVSRHERGERRLTIQWINRYAVALGVAPADIMTSTELADPTSEVEPATIEGMPQLSRIIASRGLAVYRVLHSRIPDAGIVTGQAITVDASPSAIAEAVAGDAVVAQIGGPDILILRQYIPPRLLITNERGTQNSMLRLDDRTVGVEIIGVVVRD